MAGVSRGLWTRELPVRESSIAVASPVLIGVVSDTHASSRRGPQAFAPVVDLFRRARVGLILHAGDAGSRALLHTLEEVAPVAAVRGNADPVELIEELPDRMWITAGERSILLLHGHHGKTARVAARAAARPEIDMIVYGHSHRPLIEKEGETILFNPGSPVERRWNPHFGVGIVRVSDSAVEPELILFDDAAHLANIAF
jgi:putative phosphoesterase